MRWEKVYPEEWEQKDSSVPLPPLTKEQQELVSDNLGLAKQAAMNRALAIAARYPNTINIKQKHMDIYHELLDAAWIGLCYGASKFDPSRGTKFSTCAYPWIRSHLGVAATKMDFRNATAKQGKRYWNAPLVNSFSAVVNGSEGFGGEGDYYFGDFDIWDNRKWEHEEASNAADIAETMESVSKLISSLLDKRRATIMRYRIFDDRRLADIGRELGITKERVRQIESTSLSRLKESPAFMAAVNDLREYHKKELSFTDFYPDYVGKRIA